MAATFPYSDRYASTCLSCRLVKAACSVLLFMVIPKKSRIIITITGQFSVSQLDMLQNFNWVCRFRVMTFKKELQHI